jgi:hypothetical protein
MKIEFKQVGRNLIATIKGSQLTITDSSDKLAPLKESIKEYNALLNHETKAAKAMLKKIEDGFAPKTIEKKKEVEAKKTEIKKEKKAIKNKIKATPKAEKKAAATKPKSTFDQIKELLSSNKLSKAELSQIADKIKDKGVVAKTQEAPKRRSGEY